MSRGKVKHLTGFLAELFLAVLPGNKYNFNADYRCGTKRLWKIILMAKADIYILIHVQCRKELFAAQLNCTGTIRLTRL